MAGPIREYNWKSVRVTKLLHLSILLWNQAGFWPQSCEGMKQFHLKYKKTDMLFCFLPHLININPLPLAESITIDMCVCVCENCSISYYSQDLCNFIAYDNYIQMTLKLPFKNWMFITSLIILYIFFKMISLYLYMVHTLYSHFH